MENVLRRFRNPRAETVQAFREERERAARRETLLLELSETRRRLACNEAWFQLETDEHRVEACVYERQSLLAHWRGLLEEARRERVSCPPFP